MPRIENATSRPEVSAAGGAVAGGSNSRRAAPWIMSARRATVAEQAELA
ncbi:MAG TPA: hypothetical protein VMA54_19310 [Steroidobacteraceae bacterium]|nr:hypothetical protein [Steroidobacteraceae bacterium]